jgi:hypothetical protein
VCGRCGLLLGLLSDLAAPLPAPMIEPVLTPTPTADSKPLSREPALARPFADEALAPLADQALVVTVSDRGVTTPEPPSSGETACDREAPDGGHPRIGGEDPSAATHLGNSDLPMNDSEHSPAPITIPATDRADQPPETPPPPALRAKFVVLRGVKISVEYPIYEGRNTVGRFADKPVDIDLFSQESPEQIWCSRQHAAVTFDRGNVLIEDLNSLNGTWVNGVRIHAGQPRQLRPGDVVQIGTVQMKLVVG